MVCVHVDGNRGFIPDVTLESKVMVKNIPYYAIFNTNKNICDGPPSIGSSLVENGQLDLPQPAISSQLC